MLTRHRIARPHRLLAILLPWVRELARVGTSRRAATRTTYFAPRLSLVAGPVIVAWRRGPLAGRVVQRDEARGARGVTAAAARPRPASARPASDYVPFARTLGRAGRTSREAQEGSASYRARYSCHRRLLARGSREVLEGGPVVTVGFWWCAGSHHTYTVAPLLPDKLCTQRSPNVRAGVALLSGSGQHTRTTHGTAEHQPTRPNTPPCPCVRASATIQGEGHPPPPARAHIFLLLTMSSVRIQSACWPCLTNASRGSSARPSATKPLP